MIDSFKSAPVFEFVPADQLEDRIPFQIVDHILGVSVVLMGLLANDIRQTESNSMSTDRI